MEQIIATLPKRSEEGPASQITRSISIGAISTTLVREPSLLYYLIKRLLDIVLAAFGILVLIPVFLIIAVCIKLDDGGDILHFREIIGCRWIPDKAS